MNDVTFRRGIWLIAHTGAKIQGNISLREHSSKNVSELTQES